MNDNVVIEVAINTGNTLFMPLDMNPGQAVTLNYKSNLLSSIESITCSSSYTIKVPHTANNDYILKLAKVPQISSNQLYRKIACRVITNGIDMTGDAWCYITNCDKDAYSLVITFGLMQNLGAWINQKPSLRSLNPYAYGSDVDIEGTVWNPRSGVNIWASSYRSKYNRFRKAMYFGDYDCGANNKSICNIHPFVTLREIYERIINENSLDFIMPDNVNGVMETTGLLLTSDNTRGEADYTVVLTAKSNPKKIGHDEGQLGSGEGTIMAIDAGESDYCNLNTHYMYHLDDVHSYGFLRKGDKSATIHADTNNQILVTGRSDVYIKPGLTYYQYFATGDLSLMKLYYPTPDGMSYVTPSRRNIASGPYGTLMVGFTLPDIVSNSYDNYIGALVFTFSCAGSEHHTLAVLDPQYITIGRERSTSWGGALQFSYTYTMKEVGYPDFGLFNLVENLPDISQIDFIKTLCQMFGLFPVVSDGRVEFVAFSVLTTNIKSGNYYDWSNKLTDTGKPSPYKIEFGINNYAQHNTFGYKHDDQDRFYHDSTAILEVDNELLEKEKKLVEFPFAASSVKADQRPIMGQYEINERNELEFHELAYRLLEINGVLDNETGSDVVALSKTLAFPQWLEADALFENGYSDYQSIVRKPKVITEKFLLNEYDLKKLDFTVPVYLSKYGRYFAVISALWSSNSKTSEVKLLLL